MISRRFFKKIIFVVALLFPLQLRCDNWIDFFISGTFSAVWLFAGYVYLSVPDRSLPTFEQLNVVTFLPIKEPKEASANQSKQEILEILKRRQGQIKVKGTWYQIEPNIPDRISDCGDKPIFVYSGGFSNEGKPYAYCVYNALKAGTIAKGCPCVVSDCTTDARRSFTFCQKQDLHIQKLVLERLVEKKKDAKVILYGACKGGACQLRYLQDGFFKEHCCGNIVGAIIESPPVSVEDALKHFPLSHALTCFYFPNYSPKDRTIMDATSFPTIPIFIGSLPGDHLSNLEPVSKMVDFLNSKGGDITHCICYQDRDIWHGKIGTSKEFQQGVQEFYQEKKLFD